MQTCNGSWMILTSISRWNNKVAPSCLLEQAAFLCFQGCLDTLYIPTILPVSLSTLLLSVAQWPNTVPSLSLCPGISFLRSVIWLVSALYYLYSFQILFQATEKIIIFLKSYYTYNFKQSLALSICLSYFPTCSLIRRAMPFKIFHF